MRPSCRREWRKPGPSLGGTVFVRGRVKRVSLALEGRYDLPASTDVGRATVETSLGMASIAPCFHFGWAAACAVGSLGSLHATSRGVAKPREDRALYVAVGARVAAELRLAGPLSAWARVDATVPLRPYPVTLDGEAFAPRLRPPSRTERGTAPGPFRRLTEQERGARSHRSRIRRCSSAR
jgi:hypothetical protein